MSKIVSGSNTPSIVRNPESIATTENFTRNETISPVESAHIIGQPEGPFGTAAVARHTVLIRSLGAARFSKFETLELAHHGLFIVCANPKQNPYQAKSTLLEIQLFLGEPTSAGTRMIKGIGRIEEVRAAVDVPLAAPAGYVVKFLQISSEDSNQLEKYIRERLLNAAI